MRCAGLSIGRAESDGDGEKFGARYAMKENAARCFHADAADGAITPLALPGGW